MNKTYYEKNKDLILEKAKSKYKKSSDYAIMNAKNQHLKRYFKGMTSTEARNAYDQLLEKQNKVCAICKKPETKVDSQRSKTCLLAVDHDHETGAVRGLLCFVCNTTLGRFERNFTYILNYLREAKLKHIRSKLNEQN